jgi:phospholipid/cholesterol/gamma-HCH transport system permease protein
MTREDWASPLRVAGALAQLAGRSLAALVTPRWEFSQWLRQMETLGWRSLGVASITTIFTGMVLALQTAYSLPSLGVKYYIGSVVGKSLVRELGPVLVALIVGGRVGAGITAELGTMAVTEQIEAIRALGASPVRVLVVPRLLAVMIMLPILTIVADLVGVLGGLFIGTTELRVSSDFYWNSLLYGMVLNDLFSGIGKSMFFAYFIGIIACYNGLHVTGGADGVGRATTSTVVAASITILIADFFLTKLFLIT